MLKFVAKSLVHLYHCCDPLIVNGMVVPSNYEKHKTTKVKINGKLIDIDVHMAPIVLWINTFPGAKTFHCCQGEKMPCGDGIPVGMWGENEYRPYLHWSCSEPYSTNEIFKFFDEWSNGSYINQVRTTMFWDRPAESMQFVSNWYDLESLKGFNQYLISQINSRSCNLQCLT